MWIRHLTGHPRRLMVLQYILLLLPVMQRLWYRLVQAWAAM
jgi:hypothetical protein